MTREEARKKAELMMAYADGKDIEFRQAGENWDICKGDSYDELEFNFNICEYRIKQEPTYRPFKDKDECWAEMQKHQPFGWVKDIDNIEYMDIRRVGTEGIDGYDYSKIFNCFTFADGTPFGIKEEKE